MLPPRTRLPSTPNDPMDETDSPRHEDELHDSGLSEHRDSQNSPASGSHSPPIRNNSQETLPPNPTTRTQNSSSAFVRTRGRVISRPRNRLRGNPRGAGRLMRLETKVNNISNQLNKYIRNNENKRKSCTNKYPKIPMTTVIEGDQEFAIIGEVKIKTDVVAEMLLKNHMRTRADTLMHALWPPSLMKRMYFKLPNNDENAILITSEDLRKVRDTCLTLQSKKEIEYIQGGTDDITIHLRHWTSVLIRQCRYGQKKKERQHQR
ncbi:uncharacterized protein LOC141523914 [Cotesia typhae]|uniref:uncharacterized protein LOC141523914 n=1 Tax=Cotesia typhae TaxID=2053667 RepID=UPI003D6968B3